MATDPLENVVLFGGYWGGTYVGDTWVWNGTDWTLKSPEHSPPARSGHAMATDGSGNVVLFGGYTTTLNGETWVWA